MDKRPSHIVADIERRIDSLIKNTEVHIPEMIAIQIELARSSSRCATRQRASAKVIDWHVEALAMKANLKEPEHDEDKPNEKVKVLVLDRNDIEIASQRATALRDAEMKKLGK